MKKIVLCLTLIMTAIVLTACGKENVSLNLEDLSSKLDNLKGEEFDRFTAANIINEKIEGLKEIYDYEYDFKENFGLNSEDIEFYTIAMNENNMDMYLFIQPLEDKKSDVKLALDNYFSELEKNENQEIADKAKNKSYTQIGSYLIYIMTDNSADILNSIKDKYTVDSK